MANARMYSNLIKKKFKTWNYFFYEHFNDIVNYKLYLMSKCNVLMRSNKLT